MLNAVHLSGAAAKEILPGVGVSFPDRSITSRIVEVLRTVATVALRVADLHHGSTVTIRLVHRARLYGNTRHPFPT